MNRGYFQITSSNEYMLDVYVQTYNEIYTMLYEFVLEIKGSLLTRTLRDQIKQRLFECMMIASLRLEPPFAEALLYHIITDIGLRLNSKSMIYYLIEVLGEYEQGGKL